MAGRPKSSYAMVSAQAEASSRHVMQAQEQKFFASFLKKFLVFSRAG
jgi:hypothetical protein